MLYVHCGLKTECVNVTTICMWQSSAAHVSKPSRVRRRSLGNDILCAVFDLTEYDFC